MKLVEIYKTLLNEAEIESCVKKFGYELFGSELNGKEKNTGVENQYVRDIVDFTDNKYGQETDHGFINAIKTLKGCMKQYPEVLVPDSSNVYRGITIPIKHFIEGKQVVNLTNKMPYTYKASSKIQSWSDNYNIAATFGNHDTLNEVANSVDFKGYNTPEARQGLLTQMIVEDLRIAFILEYHTNKEEFMFKSKYFRVLSNAYHEDEVLRVENKPINVFIKFNDHEDVFLGSKGLILLKYINKAIEESK